MGFEVLFNVFLEKIEASPLKVKIGQSIIAIERSKIVKVKIDINKVTEKFKGGIAHVMSTMWQKPSNSKHVYANESSKNANPPM